MVVGSAEPGQAVAKQPVAAARRKWIGNKLSGPGHRHLGLEPGPVVDVQLIVGVGPLLAPEAILAFRHEAAASEHILQLRFLDNCFSCLQTGNRRGDGNGWPAAPAAALRGK